MKRLIQAGMVLATVATAILGGGSALANSNANGSVSVTPSTTTPGGTVHISGSVDIQSCPRSDDVTIGGPSALFPPDGFGPTVSRDANGDFAVDYTVPTSTPPGSYLITLRCGGGNVGVSAELRVESAPSGAPATGAGGAARGSSVLWTLLGLGSLTLASAFVVLRRKLG
jgi:type 1 fimbria pilin